MKTVSYTRGEEARLRVAYDKASIPAGYSIKGPEYRDRQYVQYNCPGDAYHGRIGFVNNILYAPHIDHYYQRIRVNIGNYNFIESASRFWMPAERPAS